MAPQKCHYEVLGVPSTATAEELKSAYRRLALVWHPDKNQHRIEEATAAFKEIQSAYEVLGDKHERAWYDNHRESIIRGGDEDDGEASAFEVDLWQYFSASAYSGFEESSKGFYAVYSGIFYRIFSVEVAFARRFGDGGSGLEEGLSPAFGHRDSPYESVAKFYSYWMNFVTCKDFGWVAEYNLKDAPNRKVRRLMEAENQKIQKKAKSEFNETVRQLVAFVRKRDKRVIEHKAAEAQKKKEKEEEVKKLKEEKAREKAAKAKAYKDQEWTQPDEDVDEIQEDDDWFGGGKKRGQRKGARNKSDATAKPTASSDKKEDEGQEEEDPSDPDDLFCVVCNKAFRSEQQLKNHERSKKHLEKVEELRLQLLEEEGEDDDEDEDEETEAEETETEEEESRNGNPEESGYEVDDTAAESEGITEDLDSKGSGDRSKKAGKKTRHKERVRASPVLNGADEFDMLALDGEDDESSAGDRQGERAHRRAAKSCLKARTELARSKRRDAISQRAKAADSDDADYESGSEGGDTGADTGAETEADLLAMLARHRISSSGKNPGGQYGPQEVPSDHEAREDSTAAGKGVNPGRAGEVGSEPEREGERGKQEDGKEASGEASLSGEEEGGDKGKAKGGRRRRRAPKDKKAEESKAQAPPPADGWEGRERERRGKGRKGKKGGGREDVSTCGICREEFESRNQLFKHIAATGHAQLKDRK